MKKEVNVKRKLDKIFYDIKSVKIQGATNIAKSALYAYLLSPTEQTKKTLLSLRPTEPMLINTLNKLNNQPKEKILNHFNQAQEEINQQVFKIIKKKEVIFTHCHSTNVIKSLIYSKKKGKLFEVYNTETRPLFQGRKTAEELAKAGIKVTNFVDSAVSIALEGKQGNKKATKIFLGADAILSNGDVINKVGSGMITEIAKNNKIPVYIIADSWKFSNKNINLEQRDFKEIWNKTPKHVKIKNPAFELIKRENIYAIVSELGVLFPRKFVKKAKKLV